MEPGKTSFFQALGVPTKIARGTIEITTDLKLVTAGAKVGASEATLLNMLNISPFTYGMGITQVYDQGNAFPPDVLDIGEEQLLKSFGTAVSTIASLSLALNYPTLPSVFHSLINSYKNVLAVAVSTEYSWPEIEELKDRIANPDAYAAAAPAAGAADSGAPAAAEETKEAEKSDEESDEEGGFGDLLYVLPTVPSTSSMQLTNTPAVKSNGSDEKLVLTVSAISWFMDLEKGSRISAYSEIDHLLAGHVPSAPVTHPYVTDSIVLSKRSLSTTKRLVEVEIFLPLYPCPGSMIIKKSKSFLTLNHLDDNPSLQHSYENHSTPKSILSIAKMEYQG